MIRKNTTAFLASLREVMKDTKYVSKPLHAYIIPSVDAHQSEYTAACDRRREFISGFTGSLGLAVVTETKAAMWTDGRYYIQAQLEMDHNWTLMKQDEQGTLKEGPWLVSQLCGAVGAVVGADPLLVDCVQWEQLSAELRGAGHELVAVDTNLVDVVWAGERPPRPANTITMLEVKWTGREHINKLHDLRRELRANNCAAIVLTALDDVAYLLNLRGSDIMFNPVFFSYAVVTLDDAALFVAADQLSEDAEHNLITGPAPLQVRDYAELQEYLREVVEGLEQDGDKGKVWLPTRCSHAIERLVPAQRRLSRVTPITLAKNIKNDVEIMGMESCHRRDGAAVCRFLAWLQEEAPAGKQTELSAAAKLQQYREEQENFRGLSFETISSVGSNAAIVHYKPAAATNKNVTTDEVYLVDSGGHYSDGTTDVTRTVFFGTAPQELREAFTRVVKGHIALASLVFPRGVTGHRLDAFARASLWAGGLDYGHGTGHGIGMFLNVHEAPSGISWRIYPEDPGMQAGMFVSDEPGYYKEGEYGIRVESILRIVTAITISERAAPAVFLTFKPTTLVPIQTSLLDRKLLTDQEVRWLNAYHERVGREVGPLLRSRDNRAYDWLLRETAPIAPVSTPASPFAPRSSYAAVSTCDHPSPCAPQSPCDSTSPHGDASPCAPESPCALTPPSAFAPSAFAPPSALASDPACTVDPACTANSVNALAPATAGTD